MADEIPSPAPGDRSTAPGIGAPLGAHVGAPSLRRVGEFTLVSLIDSGGMGVVYEAVQDSPRRPVAVKVMLPSLASKEALRRFELESKILASLDHPGVAQVFAAGVAEADGARLPWFAMERVVGARRITQFVADRSLSAAERAELMARVCDAVHHAHERGVVHRDIKPGNILVDAGGAPKLIDFGVARAAASKDATLSERTLAGELVGTLQYAAPEQVEGDPRRVDRRCDVHALGLVLHELLTGRPAQPVGGMERAEAICAVRERRPERLGKIDPALEGGLEDIVSLAVEKDPADRYPTAAAMAEDLRAFVRGDVPRASRGKRLPGVLRPARRFVRRHPVATAVVCAAVGAGFSWWPGEWALFTATDASSAVARLMLSIAPPAAAGGALEDVRIIALDDGTDMAALESLLGPTDDATPRSIRRAHARLLERLAPARPSVVAMDLLFYGETEHDGAIAEGARRLAASGVDVVIAMDQWWLPDGTPPMSPVIAAATRWGAATVAPVDGESLWSADLANRRGDADPVLSLAAEAFAAASAPGHFVQADYRPGGVAMRLRYWRRAGESPSARAWKGRVDLISPVFAAEEPEAQPHVAIAAGDVTAQLMFTLPSDDALKGATIDLGRALAADDAELAGLVGGKAVLIGDFRDGRDEVGRRSSGPVHGCWVQAAALQTLLSGGAVRAVHPDAEAGLRVLAALMGATAGFFSRGKALGIALGAVSAVCVCIGISAALAHFIGAFSHPAGMMMATATATLMAGGASRIRRGRGGLA